jgi:hypothetical protein
MGRSSLLQVVMRDSVIKQDRYKFMLQLLVVLFLWWVSWSFASMFYKTYISHTGDIGFIDELHQPYRKGQGTVSEKEYTDRAYRLIFTYPDGDNSFHGVMTVSEKEFNRTQIGDKIPIFYGIVSPERWLPVTRGKVASGGVALIIMTLITFLIGASILYQAIHP